MRDWSPCRWPQQMGLFLVISIELELATNLRQLPEKLSVNPPRHVWRSEEELEAHGLGAFHRCDDSSRRRQNVACRSLRFQSNFLPTSVISISPSEETLCDGQFYFLFGAETKEAASRVQLAKCLFVKRLVTTNIERPAIGGIFDCRRQTKNLMMKQLLSSVATLTILNDGNWRRGTGETERPE